MKRLPITAELRARLSGAFGADADISNLVVYECIAANTLPLRKTGGFYKGAQFTENTLYDMAASVNSESVPLHMQHDTSATPMGRAFAGKVVDRQLYVQFAVSGNETDVITKLDNGTLDQVSVGILSKHALCSACGYDYFATEAGIYHLWDGECPEGHSLGEGGVHLQLSGLDLWSELSVVGKGAVRGARVVSPSESKFSADHRLAASGVSPSVLVLHSTATKKDSNEMDLAALVAKVEAGAVERVALQARVDSIPALEARATAAETRVTELEAQVAAAPKAEDHEAAVKALKDIALRSCVATGDQSPQLPEDVAGLVALIADRQAKLTALIPLGPKSKSADADRDAAPVASLSAFRTN